MIFSYHTHSEFCDGRAAAASMAAAAHGAGYSILGFSSHAPLPFATTWNMKWERIHDYERTIRALSQSWKAKGLDILLGLEIDYIEGVVSPKDEAYNVITLDYRIGCVHYIASLPGEAFTVDEAADAFGRHIAQNANGDASLVWKEYYRNVVAMIEGGGFDILGHIDLVKKNNAGGRWFDETSKEYLDAAFSAVDRAAELDTVAEINTGGVARGKTASPYPSLPILKRMREKGLRITIGDDAHSPSHIGPYQSLAVEWARAAGYASLWYLDAKRVWHEIGIEEAGKP